MITELFEVFPYLENDKVIIRKMESSDVVALCSIRIILMYLWIISLHVQISHRASYMNIVPGLQPEVRK